MARKQYESKFISEIKKSIRYYYPEKTYWYKIPDDRKFKKPFDAFLAIDGKHYAIEFKTHTKKDEAWYLSDVKEHQVEGLVKASRGGYRSCILLNVKYANPRTNFTRLIKIEEFIEWQEKDIRLWSVKHLQESNNCFYKERIDKLEESLWPVKNIFL